MADVNEIIARAREMPLLSESAVRLLETLGREGHTLEEVTQIVETDQGLTVRALKLANSAAYRRREEVNTVSMAIQMLGESLISSIAMELTAGPVFKRPLLGYEGRKGELWAHGLRTAIAAFELAPFAREEVKPGLAYTAGLLHDVGKSVLSKFMGGLPADILKKIDSGEAPDYLTGEKQMVGMNHCEIGLELARHWQLPEIFQMAIQHHHYPGEAEDPVKALVYVVHLADMMAMMGGTGTGSDSMGYTMDERYTDYIKIKPRQLDDIMMKVILEFEKVSGSLSDTT